MIKLICVKDSLMESDRKDMDFLNKVATEKGCKVIDLFPIFGKEYTLINVVSGQTLLGTNNNLWYMLEETGLIHHSSLFAISPSSIRDLKLGSLINEN